MNTNFEEEIKKVRFSLVCSFPELVFLLETVKIEVTEKEKSQGHIAATDGKRILLTEEYFNLDKFTKEFILFHELLHIILGHVFRLKNRNPEVWNLATDAIVNEKDSNFLNRPIPQGSVTFDFLRGINPDIKEKDPAELIYKKLIDKLPPKSGIGKGGSGSNNKSSSKIPSPFDKLIPNPSLTEEDERKMESILEQLVTAMKDRGKDPGIFEEVLELRKRKRRLPKEELAEILKRGVIIEDYSPNLNVREWHAWQRFGIFTPEPICSIKRPVIIVIDSSGSTWDWWRIFLEEVLAIVRDKTEVFLIQIDAKIQDISKITTPPKELKLKGGGGTDFKEFFEFEWIKKLRMTRRELRDSIIFFLTDLNAFNVPDKCPLEINQNKFYWVLIEKTKIPWGKDIPWYELSRKDFEED